MSQREFDPLKRWGAKLELAQKLIAERETLAARVALQELVSFVDQTWGPDDVHLIRPLRLIAASHFLDHEPLDPNNQAEAECFRRALAIARLRLGGDHTEVAALAGELGSALVVAGSVDEGCVLMIECLEIATRLGEADYFSRYLGLIAHARMAQGRPQEALGFFQQAVSACERVVPSSSVVAVERYHLGRCLRQLGRPKDALVELELALSIASADRADPGFVGAVRKEITLVAREL